MTELLSLGELEKKRVDASETYEARRSAAESLVVRWEWATGPLHSLEPLEAERGGWPRGKLCKGEPEDPKKKYAFGFDANERIRVIREHTEFEGKANEWFVAGPKGEWVWYYVHRDHSEPMSVTQRVVGEHLEAAASKARFGHIITRYSWEDGRLRVIEEETDMETGRFEVGYTGPLVRTVWRLNADGSKRAVFEAKPVPLEKLLPTFEARLEEMVIEQLASWKPDGAVWCLGLVYSEASTEEMSQPRIAIGSAAEREKARAEGTTTADLWLPANFSSFDSDALELADSQLDELAEAIALALKGPEDYALVKRSYARVAKALDARDWAFKTAPDFVTTPLSLDGADTAENLRAALGAARVKALTKAGWL